MDISTTPYVQIYTHLKAYEPHAKKTLKKQEQSTSIVDPLAYVAHTTSAPALSSPSTPSPQPTAQSPNDALMATMTQIANLLSGFQKQFPPTNNQLRTSSNSRTHATVHDGHIVTEPIQRKAPGNVGNTGARGKKVICYNCRGEGHVARQCKEPKRKMDSQYFKDKALLMEAKEKGDVLDAEAEAFLADVECTAPYDQPQALTTTNMFQANHEDAYDSDVDEGPNAAVAFMANLSSTSATNNPVNEVHSNDNQIFDNVDYQLSQEMHQEEHLDSDAETEIDDNTIPYHQYENTNTEVLHTLHMDLCGPMRTESINGKKYVLVIVDDYTRFGWVRFLRTKDETPQVIEKFIVKTQRALNATVRFVRTDNGTEFVNKTLDGWFESVGISHETSVPRSPQQNGVVERRNRTLMEAARTMLIFAKAPLFLWAEAVATACYTLNRSLVHTLHGKTYYELLKGKKPNLQYFRVFGSLCYPTNDYDDVGKLKAKADIGIFVGYAPTKKAYRIYNKRTRKIQETVHVAFDELTEGLTSVQTSSGLAPQQMTSVPNSTELELTALQSGRSRSALVKDPEPPSVPPTKKQVDDLFQWFDDDEVVPIPPVVPITPVNVPAAPAPENANGSPSTTVISEGAPAVTESLLPHQIPLPDTSDSDVETLFDHVDSNVFDTYNAPETGSEASHSNSVNIDVTPNNQLPHVQKWTQAHPLANIIGDKDRPVSTRKQLETDAMWCFFNEFLTHVEPKTYKQALEHSCWIEAMQEEIHEFERLDVWILVPCPDNILIIPLKWIFKIKLDEYGDVLKNKARLVAKGYRQEAGIDFEESFASVAMIRSDSDSFICSRKRIADYSDDMTQTRRKALLVSSISLDTAFSWSSKKRTVLPSSLRKLNTIALFRNLCTNPLDAVQHLALQAIDYPVPHNHQEQVEGKLLSYNFVEIKYHWLTFTTKALPDEALRNTTPLLGDLTNVGQDSEGTTESLSPAKADIGIFVGYAPTKKAYRIYNKRTRKIQETVHVAFDELTEGLTSVQTSSGLAPQQMTSVPNSTELELTALQSGRSRSALVKDPEPPSVPPTKKQVDDLFQWFDDDEVVPIPVIDTSDSDDETLFDHVDSNVFDTYNAPETGSEASSSNSVNIDVTPNNQLPHVQKWTQAHPLENIIGDKDRPVSTRKQLETDAMWCFFNEFLTHVEPKTYKQALEHSCWIEAMQEEIHEFERLV
ncbi:retrovirus-related pol polyprotein from transposon TNT 1-94 [Tanacetum coccineum]|uniref:Retrovirus-related pol polyprotein from transposon TNT 1-94 n=2 Tax=Tanacetum coccineum TaxID=301880 RepID=A0ABQ5C9P2_9ASTR